MSDDLTKLREADEAASVAHDYIWPQSEGQVTKAEASDAIWRIHELLRPMITGAAIPEAGLDRAWKEAEAALPEGWTGPFVGPHYKGDYWANAWRTMGGNPGVQQTGTENLIVEEREAHGPTPQAALQALIERLRAEPAEKGAPE